MMRACSWMRPGTLLAVAWLVSLTAVHGLVAQEPGSAPSRAVRGQVVDALDGVPLRRAQVTVFPSDRPRDVVFTDDEGRFVLADAPAAEMTVRASKAGYERAIVAVPDARAGGDVRIALARSAAVEGRIAERQGDELRDTDFVMPDAGETCRSEPVVSRLAEGMAAIAGRITDASGRPIACADISVFAVSTMTARAAHTDDDGRYAVEGLTGGSFVLRASRRNYVTLEYGQRHPADVPARIPLRAGERRTRVDMTLPGATVISGTVTDEHGEPMEGIQVRGFQILRLEGRLERASSIASQPTDDRGRYRLIGAEPGTYVVAAMARGAVGTVEHARGYVTVYHPGTFNASLAHRVTVDVGDHLQGVDLSLMPTSTAVVSGSAFDASGRPFAGRLSLSPSTRSGGPAVETWSASPGPGGAFVFRHVPPGEYVVKAIGQDASAPQFGVQHVTVGNADPAPVQVVASGGATLEGRVTIEGPSCEPIAGLVAVSRAPADPDYSDVIGKAVPAFARKDDGTFRLVSVAGPTRLTIEERPGYEACYLQSARVNGTDAADRPFYFDMTDGVYRDVEVVVSDASASIEGRLVEEPDVFVSSFWVIVMPPFRELWYTGSRHLKIAQAGRDGTFRIDGLPPGDYVVAAVYRVGRAVDEDMLEALVASPRAKRVSLAERERETLELALIRR